MNRTRNLATAVVVTGTLLAGCSNEISPTPQPATPPAAAAPAAGEFVVGGLYSMRRPDGSFVVLKVLAIDEQAVHIRSYANTFMAAPTDVDPATLTLGGVDHPDGIGIGHYPVTHARLREDGPAFIKQVPVVEDELVGYRYWQRGGSRTRTR